jgi:hypothetical protein
MSMDSNVFQFPSVETPRDRALRDRVAERIKTRRETRQERYANSPPLTETAKNHRIRLNRGDVWWNAEWITKYWRAKMEFTGCLRSSKAGRLARCLLI